MTYKIELVTMESPYIALGYVKNTSIINGRLEFCRGKKDALMVTNNITYEMVKKLIKKHNINITITYSNIRYNFPMCGGTNNNQFIHSQPFP